jgi:polysaccharide biosynthesis transport protein
MDENTSKREQTEALAPEPSRKVVVQASPAANGRRSSDVLLALVRGFWLILLGVVLGAGLASLVSQLVPPVYRSEVQLLVVSTADEPPLDTTSLVTYAQTYSELATSPEVVGKVVSETGIVDPQRLDEVVTTEVSTSAPLFAIVASDRDPDNAAELANAIGSTIENRDNLARDTGFRANIIGKAVPAEQPTWPNLVLNIAVGAGMGLLLGVIAALIWNDRRRVYGK